MNAEECPRHRALIDAPVGGIYYPWICPCEETEILGIVHIDSQGEQWCKNCYAFGCAANVCGCDCHVHPAREWLA